MTHEHEQQEPSTFRHHLVLLEHLACFFESAKLDECSNDAAGGVGSPTLKEAIGDQRPPPSHMKIVGPGLPKLLFTVEAAQSIEERLVANEAAKHVEDGRALVVDEGPEDAALTLNQPEAIAEIDRPLVGLGKAPAAELAQHGEERRVAVGALGVQRGKVLRESSLIHCSW